MGGFLLPRIAGMRREGAVERFAINVLRHATADAEQRTAEALHWYDRASVGLLALTA